MLKQKPVIIRGLVSEWPAVADPDRKWSDLDYLRRIAGFRLVPVEVGSKYTEREWSQTLMPLDDFIDVFIDKCQAPPKSDWIGQNGYA
jgi:[protein]-arginine 3-hydroxylase / protease